jgi:hypothetical protein
VGVDVADEGIAVDGELGLDVLAVLLASGLAVDVVAVETVARSRPRSALAVASTVASSLPCSPPT